MNKKRLTKKYLQQCLKIVERIQISERDSEIKIDLIFLKSLLITAIAKLGSNDDDFDDSDLDQIGKIIDWFIRFFAVIEILHKLH